jgi:hypothetical protein
MVFDEKSLSRDCDHWRLSLHVKGKKLFLKYVKFNLKCLIKLLSVHLTEMYEAEKLPRIQIFTGDLLQFGLRDSSDIYRAAC